METYNPFEEIIKRLDLIQEQLNTLSNKGPESEFVDIDDAAKIMGLSKSTLYKYTFEKKIPHYKTMENGKKLFFKRAEIMNIFKKQ